MNGVFRTALSIHILFGSVALFVAPAAMLTGKGGLWHRRWGKIFFWSITGVAVTAVVMSLIRSGLFFLLVALFSFYLALTGYRILYRKTPRQRPDKLDWTAASTMLLGSLALVAYGVYLMVTSSVGIVAIVFWRDRFPLWDLGPARFHSPSDRENGLVVQPHGENAVRLYRHFDGVLRR